MLKYCLRNIFTARILLRALCIIRYNGGKVDGMDWET